MDKNTEKRTHKKISGAKTTAAEEYARHLPYNDGRLQAETEKTGAAAEQKEELLEGEMITISAQEYSALKQDLEQTHQQVSDNFDGWQRERADFSNYKKRIEREQNLLSQTITGELIKKYLPVVDDLERALKNRPADEGSSWAEGIDLIYRKLMNTLESEGVTRIPAEDELFDPTRHEAISHEDSPAHQSGQIIEVVQQGYLIGERVLRPALVRVAR